MAMIMHFVPLSTLPQLLCRYYIDRRKVIRNIEQFRKKSDFPNYLGTIDGKHVRIVKSENTDSLYYNYKKYLSIILLTVVDSNDTFTYVGIEAMPFVCVDDEAVPLSSQLIRPYGGNTLRYKKRIFNYRLTRARSIECTYSWNFI
ncbi:uncharacterized protein LOC143174447 [Nomia melanderi]|uniref:uncharacterized protein LOC143174447 n=1 Tax=Nomia melanderi TaxID=2448451 RepID=UPI003FCEC2C1